MALKEYKIKPKYFNNGILFEDNNFKLEPKTSINTFIVNVVFYSKSKDTNIKSSIFTNYNFNKNGDDPQNYDLDIFKFYCDIFNTNSYRTIKPNKIYVDRLPIYYFYEGKDLLFIKLVTDPNIKILKINLVLKWVPFYHQDYSNTIYTYREIYPKIGKITLTKNQKSAQIGAIYLPSFQENTINVVLSAENNTNIKAIITYKKLNNGLLISFSNISTNYEKLTITFKNNNIIILDNDIILKNNIILNDIIVLNNIIVIEYNYHSYLYHDYFD